MVQITVDREAEKPLYAQIRDALLKAIEDNMLQPGEQLPTVAAFASRIGVTACTVRRAYEDLTKVGLVRCQVGRGTFVTPPSDGDIAPGQGSPAASASAPPLRRPFGLGEETRGAVDQVRKGISRSLESLMALQARPGLIRFTSGIPGPSTVRPGLLEEMVHRTLAGGQDRLLVTGDPQGLPELRQVLADRYQRRGLDVTPDMILITSGAQQAFSLAAVGGVAKGGAVGCETPCYTGIPSVFKTLGHHVTAVPRDREGPMADRLEWLGDGTGALLYLVPELHNPMGADLSDDRRRYVANWANRRNGLLVADEIFSDLRVDGPAPESLLAAAGPERTVVVSSMSKAFATGLRIGWLVTARDRIRAWTPLKKALDLGCPPLTQMAARELFASGEYDLHVERVRQEYRRRRDVLIETFEEHMPAGVTWTRPAGGFNIWVELPPGYSSIVLFLVAVEKGVSFIPGPYMDMDHRFVHAFRLSFGDTDVDTIREGAERLCAAVNEVVQERPSDAGLGGLGDFL
jgi:DNA-binding transcriptional MocR family regulator